MQVGAYLESLGGVWPVLDSQVRYVAVAVEAMDGCDFQDRASVDNAVRWVRSQGREPLIYTSYFMLERLGLRSAADEWASEGIRFWLARYDGVAALDVPGPLPCVVKQYSDEGRIEGLPHPVDLNWSELFDAAPSGPAALRLTQAEHAGLEADGWIRVEGSPTIALTNEAIGSTLGTLIGDPGSPTRSYVRRNPDGTVDVRITRIPARALRSFPELQGSR